MFETQKIHAVIHKVQYDGKEDTSENKNGAAIKKAAIVSVTLKAFLEGPFLEEVERKYFPGISERAMLTSDKTKYYKEALKIAVPEQTLTIYNEETGDKLLSIDGVGLNPPLTAVCKEGIAHLFLRVQFKWLETLNILKALDQCAVEFELCQTQAEFESVLAAAKQNDHEAPISIPVFASSENEGSPEEWNPFEEEVLEMSTGEKKKKEVPPLSPTASEKPINENQVDFRLCKLRSKKEQEFLNELDEKLAYEIGQKAALLAFARMPEKGLEVKITPADVKQARSAILQ